MEGITKSNQAGKGHHQETPSTDETAVLAEEATVKARAGAGEWV